MSGADDLARADARGAGVDPLAVAGGDQRPHGLDVRVPTARRAAVRVRHRHTETGPLATDIAHGSHGGSLPEIVHFDGGARRHPRKTVGQSNRFPPMVSRARRGPAGPSPPGAAAVAVPGAVACAGYPPAVLQALDESATGRWCRAAAAALSAARARLDELNVFPVPDGDTGTNLLLTTEAALAALDRAGAQPGESAWAVLARGAVLGARGNSGTLLAQLFHGLADQLAGEGPADGPTVALAMQKAADSAYTAVADPEEGTFLTVARGGARAAVAAVDEGRIGLADVVCAAADGARAPLEGPPDQLAALRDAGVVDAGGAGLCLLLDALVTTVTGVEPARPPLGRRPP